MNRTVETIKLHKFLNNHPRFKEECEVIYLMVEIRKILEVENKSYKTLRFYCNWVLHTKLCQEKTTGTLSEIFENSVNLKKDAHRNAKNLKSVGVNFFKLNILKKELKDFFKNKELPMELLNKNWWSFAKLLLEIIKDRPVIFTPNKIKKLVITKLSNKEYHYKFSLINGRDKPIIKIKLK